MAVLLSPVYFSPDNPLWLSKNISSLILRDLDVSTLSVSSLTGNTIISQSTFTKSLSSLYSETKEQYVDDKLTLDTQVLTANSTQLLLNGIPLATISNLSSLSQWSLDPAISDVKLNGFSIYNISNTQTKNLAVSSITGSNASFINLFSQNLMAFNVVTFTSTFIDTYESTIQSDIKLANISTANICNLTVTSNATISGAVFTDAPTFNNGANFNGTRPNFNTGINTTGPNNFNNCNIDNASNINGAIINVSVGGQTNITADAGNYILGNPAVNLVSQGGGSSAIRIQAKACSPVAFPIPNSSVDVLAEGNVSYIPIAPVPYGGLITIRAKAGGANPLTSPLSFLAGNGAIRLTADSYIPFGELYPPIPGVIALGGGAVLSFSGLTTPTTGPYGCSFYSALTCLSLTCGATPALTSYPGTVYLRGDNGTKVLNGLYVDTLYNAYGYDLNITSQSGNWVNIDKAQSIRMSNSGLLDGGGAGSRISNVETITASNITTSQLNVANLSTGAITLPQFYTSHINIAPSNTVYITSPNLTIEANAVTDEFENPLPNNLNLIASSNVNITIPNNNAYSIYLNGNVRGSKSIIAPIVSTQKIICSSISGTTFTGDLNMNNNNISNIHNIYSADNLNIYAPPGLAIGFNNIVYFNNDAVFNTGANLNINCNAITNVSRIENASGDLSINIPAQTYFNNAGFVQFNVDSVRMYRGYLDMENHDIYNAKTITGINRNALVFDSNFSRLTGESNIAVEGATGYVEIVANSVGGGTGNIYLTGSYIEARGNMVFSGSNKYIYNLGHIYGDTSAPGGGLSIDGMFGMFFNSAGHNANLFVDSAGYHMLNYNTFIDINAVNSDTYIGAGQTINLNATTGVGINSGGAGISIASDNNIYFTANGTYKFANFQETNVAFNSGSAGSLSMYMNGHNIRNVGDLTRNLGSAVVSQPVIQYGTDGTGSGASGSVTVTIPNTYTSRTTYVVQVTMRDAPAAQLYATPITGNTFTIGWTSAGTGTQNIMWVTFGT